MSTTSEQGRTHQRLEKLTPLLVSARHMAIVLQDYPDPDALAAGAALRELGNRIGDVACTFAHGGAVGRAENKALVRYLGLNLRSCADLDFERFDLVAMVDTQPGTGNNALPGDIVPDLVFDHHPIRRRTRSAGFTDVRSRYGAASTILFEYLTAAGIALDIPLATALVYGIRSDTQDLGREAIQADIDAHLQLYPMANKRMLSRIEHATVPRDYFLILGRALTNAVMAGNCVWSDLGEMDNPDMIAEVADLLQRNETTEWTLCFGVHRGDLLLSLRSSEPNADAGKLARRLVGRRGTGGGHSAFAGGQIPLKTGADSEARQLAETVVLRFVRAVGATGVTPYPLVP